MWVAEPVLPRKLAVAAKNSNTPQQISRTGQRGQDDSQERTVSLKPRPACGGGPPAARVERGEGSAEGRAEGGGGGRRRLLRSCLTAESLEQRLAHCEPSEEGARKS